MERAVTVGWAPPNSDSLYGGDAATAVCVHVCVHAYARVRACVRACVRDVFAIYDNIFDPGCGNPQEISLYSVQLY